MDELIRALLGSGPDIYLIDAEVLSVDKGARTCSVECLTGKTRNTVTVRLMSAIGDGVLIVPAIGSTITFLAASTTLPVAFQYSEVDEIVFRGGDLKGLLKIDNTVQKLNIIEADINKLKTDIASWVVIPSDGGAALKTKLAAWTGNMLTETKVSDLENKTITHG